MSERVLKSPTFTTDFYTLEALRESLESLYWSARLAEIGSKRTRLSEGKQREKQLRRSPVQLIGLLAINTKSAR